MSSGRDPLSRGVKPYANDYFDTETGEFLLDISLGEPWANEAKTQFNYPIMVINKKTKSTSKGFYIKVKDVHTTFDIAEEFENEKTGEKNKVCKVSFDVPKVHKLLEIIKILTPKIRKLLVKKILQSKKPVDLYRKIKRKDDIIDQMDMLPKEYTFSKNYINHIEDPDENAELEDYTITGSKIRFKKGSDDHLLRTGTGFADTNIQDFNAIYDYNRAIKKLERARKKADQDDSRILELEEEVKKYRERKTKTSSIIFKWDNINKIIPRGTKLRYFGFRISGVFLSDLMVAHQAFAKDILYTDECISYTNCFDEDEFDSGDETDEEI